MRYRFLWLNDNGSTIQTLVSDFADDVSALESATKCCGEYAIDIYQFGRRVEHLKKGNAELDVADKSSL